MVNITDSMGLEEVLATLLKLRRLATPGEWWCESVRSEDGRGRFDAAALHAPARYLGGKPISLLDTINGDDVLIEEDVDEESGHSRRVDGQGTMNLVYLAELHNVLPRLDELIRRTLDEVTYWRQDAAARLRTAVILARAAERDGELDEAARIRVGVIFPTIAALENALAGALYYPCCEGCGEPIKPGAAVYTYLEGEVVHVDCAEPAKADPLPPEARRHQVDPDYTPEGILEALAEAKAYRDEEDPAHPPPSGEGDREAVEGASAPATPADASSARAPAGEA